MSTIRPPVSSVGWASYATGVGPGRHGIYGLIERRPGGYDLFVPGSGDVQVPTLWEALGCAGKTTIVDLITGLVRPDAGRVLVDRVPLPEIDLGRWRRSIGYVTQETLLFNDSIRTNVTLGDPALGAAEVEGALREAGAWGVVTARPEGVDAPVGERGALLSGGQRK